MRSWANSRDTRLTHHLGSDFTHHISLQTEIYTVLFLWPGDWVTPLNYCPRFCEDVTGWFVFEELHLLRPSPISSNASDHEQILSSFPHTSNFIFITWVDLNPGLRTLVARLYISWLCLMLLQKLESILSFLDLLFLLKDGSHAFMLV